MAQYSICLPETSQELVDILNNIFDGFKIKAKCIKGIKHRHFLLFDVVLQPGCRVNDIAKFSEEMALAMKSVTPILVTSIPKEGIVRLQTTHCKASILKFKEYNDYVFYNYPLNGIMPFVIGEACNGQPIIMDMAENPHLLVAGSTGSGKSVLLHSLIANALNRNDTEIYLSDTKKIEFIHYNKDRKYNNIVFNASDYDATLYMLQNLYEEMEQRYTMLSSSDQISMKFNFNFSKILVIIDEVADLMLHSKDKIFEDLIVKLAQKARAANIYIVLATQRPSVNILTGIIKANFPARIAFKVSSNTDSRVILDASGAENLAGKGDGIINNAAYNYVRFQATYIDQNDIENNC